MGWWESITVLRISPKRLSKLLFYWNKQKLSITYYQELLADRTLRAFATEAYRKKYR
jgi:hypothetical protein